MQNLQKVRRSISAISALFVASMAAEQRVSAASVYGWGFNDSGQLGVGSSTSYYSTPQAVSGLGGLVSSVSAGELHSMAIQEGALYAWGYNATGQVGDGTNTSRSSPVLVVGMSSGITAASSGGIYSLAIQNGTAYSWGYNRFGQLGDGTTIDHNTPMPIVGLSSNVTAIAAGEANALAIMNGGLYGWGWNSVGMVGDGTTIERNVPTAVTSMSSGVTAIGAGEHHCMAIKGGALYSWGLNIHGELGDGTTANRLTPSPVLGMGSGVTDLAVGFDFSLAIKDGHVYTWGNNQAGELGDGTTLSHNTPQLVNALAGMTIVDVAASRGAGFALTDDGNLWAWGSSTCGELGLGEEPAGTNVLTPMQVAAPTGYKFASISAHASGAFALATVVPVPEPASLFVLNLLGSAMLCRRSRLSRTRPHKPINCLSVAEQ